jgi:hypothetical protein
MREPTQDGVLLDFALASEERLEMFIRSLLVRREVWALGNETGYALLKDGTGNRHVGLWPHSKHALLSAQQDWKGFSPERFAIEELFGERVPYFASKNVGLAIFPNLLGEALPLPAQALEQAVAIERGRYGLETADLWWFAPNPPRLSPADVQLAQTLRGNARYEAFLQAVHEHGGCWALRSQLGLLQLPDESQNRKFTPLWPHPTHAEACLEAFKGYWTGYSPTFIDLYILGEDFLDEQANDGDSILAFMTPGDQGILVEPKKLKADLLTVLPDAQ